MKNLKLWAIGLLAVVLSSCGGGGGGALTGDGNPVAPTGSSAVATIQLVLSSNDLLSDQETDPANSNFVKITAVVRDANNSIVTNADLVFDSSSGLIQEINNGVTNASGIAEALLTSFGDVSNRTITVTVSSPSEGVSSVITVNVVGTELEITGPVAVAQGDTPTLTLTLLDGNDAGIAGQSISLNSANGNTIPARRKPTR